MRYLGVAYPDFHYRNVDRGNSLCCRNFYWRIDEMEL